MIAAALVGKLPTSRFGSARSEIWPFPLLPFENKPVRLIEFRRDPVFESERVQFDLDFLLLRRQQINRNPGRNVGEIIMAPGLMVDAAVPAVPDPALQP